VADGGPRRRAAVGRGARGSLGALAVGGVRYPRAPEWELRPRPSAPVKDDMNMKYALFVPMPHAVVHTEALQRSARGGRTDLPAGVSDPGFILARDMTVEADRAGYYAALFAERLLGPDLEAWCLANAVAPYTRQIRIMPAVHPGLWHPVLAAKMLASLDRIAPGRSAVNLVTGWFDREYEMFGGRPHADDREKYVEAIEWVEIIRRLYASEQIEYHGEVHTIADGELPIAPAGGPPPFFTASRSDEGLDMVARIADWWFVAHGKGNYLTGVSENERAFEATLAQVTENIAKMEQLSDRYDRRVRYAINAFGVVADTDAEAVERARYLTSRADSENPRIAMIQTSGMTAGLVGSAATIRDRIARYEELGVELILLKVLPEVQELRTLSECIRSVSPAQS